MPRTSRHVLIALATATLAASGLATAGAADAATAHAAATVRTVGQGSSGRTIGLTKSHELKIVLRTAVDGGYRWVITHRPNGAVVKVSRPKLTAYPHQPGGVGYPYRTTYVLTAVGTGSARISLAERQSGSPAQVAERFTLRLHVTAPRPRAVASHACTQTSSGSCIRGGEFCPQASYGQSGWDAAGTRYVCTGDHTHPHWERP